MLHRSKLLGKRSKGEGAFNFKKCVVYLGKIQREHFPLSKRYIQGPITELLGQCSQKGKIVKEYEKLKQTTLNMIYTWGCPMIKLY